MYKSRKELKALARAQMQGKYLTLIGAFILQIVIGALLDSLAISLFPETDMLSNILYYITLFVIELFMGVFYAGMYFINIKIACGMPCKVSDIYQACRENPSKAVQIQLVFAVINTICALPANLMSLASSDSIYSQLGIILILSLFGTALATLLSLPFALAFYMYWDFPEYNTKYILSHSIELMKGNCLRFLGLQISFLPLLALSLLSFGIGTLWVTPYINVTCANFYLDLMAKNNKA